MRRSSKRSVKRSERRPSASIFLISMHEFIEWAKASGAFLARSCFWIMYFVGLLWLLSLEIPDLAAFYIRMAGRYRPVWAPVVLVIAAFRVWVWYVQSLFLAGRKPVLARNEIPARYHEISARDGDSAHESLAFLRRDDIFDRAWKGQVRPYIRA